MASWLDTFRSNAAQLKSRLKDTREDLEKARRRREELFALPPPAEEICDRLVSILDQRAEWYKTNLLKRLQSLAGECAKLESSQGLQSSLQLLQNPAQYSAQEMEGLLAYLVRDQVRNGILKALKDAGLKCGPALKARPVELRQLEARITELEGVEASMLRDIDSIQREVAL